MTNINKMENIDLHIDSDYSLEEMNEKYDYVKSKISKEFIRLQKHSEKLSNLLQINCSCFEEQELIEEQMDKFMYEYIKCKELFRHGREIRIYKESKEIELDNQKKFARNVLIHYGIDPLINKTHHS